MAEDTLLTRLARIEAHIKGCIFRGSPCERWTNKHETQLTWTTNRINEARREQDELTVKVEELNELVVELTTQLNQGENQIRSMERVCTFRASYFHTQLHQLQGNMENQSTSMINPVSPPLNPLVQIYMNLYTLALYVEKEGITLLSL